MAWKRLKDKYEPRIVPRLIKLKQEFQKSMLKNAEEDPEKWITSLSGICRKLNDMGSTMTDKDFIIHILNNLLSKYGFQVVKLEDQLDSKKLTVNKLVVELQLRCARLRERKMENKMQEVEKPENNDKVFAAFGRNRGRCWNCRKLGHKAFQCKMQTAHINKPEDQRLSKEEIEQLY